MAKINRREVLLVGAGAVVAKTLAVTTACARSGRSTPTSIPSTTAAGDANTILAAAAHTCCGTGRNCLQHCLNMLARGDTSLAETAQSVHEMIAVCEGTATLAAAGSDHLALAARLCEAVCQSVVDAHTASGAQHEACLACVDACRHTIKAARAIV
jgi:Cys-rich four helix bundle protein (predicted Tat secretion target)